jgi:glutamine phosphoribosylpyrophosphate amidotransferase
MCGVIGYKPIGDVDRDDAAQFFGKLMRESRVRGMHAFGVAQPSGVTRAFELDAVIAAFRAEEPAVAHCRYSTSGDWHDHRNNQPIVVGKNALALNGVISMGTQEEFEVAFSVQCESDNDAEVFLRRMAQGQTAREFLAPLDGSLAAVWLDTWSGSLHAIRNERRPLWRAAHSGAVWYASTADIFRRAGFDGINEVQPGVEEVW